MNNVKRLFLVLLAAIMCSGSIVGCASTEETDTPADISNPTAEVEETEAETEAPDPFADFDYNGQSFRVYTSAVKSNSPNLSLFPGARKPIPSLSNNAFNRSLTAQPRNASARSMLRK